jgi:hypothetical protein
MSRCEAGRALREGLTADWDFRVEVDDFAVVAADLPRLASVLGPLAGQWDRLSPHQCYMLMLPRRLEEAVLPVVAAR